MTGQEHDNSIGRPVYFRLSFEQHARLRALAEAEHRTVSQEVRRLVEQLLAEHEPKKEAA